MSLETLKDEELFKLIKEDNRLAFNILYKRYWKKLLFKTLVKIGSHQDAEEIVQDTLFRIWKYRKTIELRYKFSTYLAAILAYIIMDKIADLKKIVGTPTEDILELDIEDNSTQNNLDYSDLLRELEVLMGALPEKCKLIYRMSRIDGKSHKEISEELNISVHTIKKHINRALKDLKLKFSTVKSNLRRLVQEVCCPFNFLNSVLKA
ncbi:RNA polymerase sigma factor [Pedobacter sp. L105]|uniref:RNA polymerase sigma factor n=1 Tax=Pedobacter sp. L105 TaxID=1641871 RepID=UPI00131B6DDE|nr:sigma-70 family RNA polymerase sigma factor [Pedobacter sp. L105]